jgi:outer membrane protein assembly factor BamA
MMNATFRRFLWLAWTLVFLLFDGLMNFSRAQVFIENNALLRHPLAVIEITGNSTTQEEIILRELESKIGAVPSRSLLRKDRLRLQGMNLFNRVEFSLVGSPERSVLVIQVTEKWYILPLPFWYFKDQDPHKLVYGFRYYQRNFRGRNETLSMTFWSGADRGYSFIHYNPWMKNTPQLSRFVELFQVTRTSRRSVVDGKEERASRLGLGLGKRWSVHFASEVTGRFRLVKGVDSLQMAGTDLLDRIVETSVGSVMDLRDLATFPMDGFYFGAGFLNGWIFKSDRQYQRLFLEARGYFPLRDRISLASHLSWTPGWGYVPPYDWFYLREIGPIRSPGAYGEGKSSYRFIIEGRFDLTGLHYFTWKRAPFFPQYFRNLEYGLAAELFFDAGDAYNDPSQTGWRAMRQGYGVGLMLRLPYLSIMRLEVAANPRRSVKDVSFAVRSAVSF